MDNNKKEDKPKMVIVMRKDLKVPKGKYCSQASHAAVGAVLQAIFGFDYRSDEYSITPTSKVAPSEAVTEWLATEYTKITLCVKSLDELEEIERKAKNAGLNVCKITDLGHTCFDGVKTVTCLAIGPDYSSKIDPITKDLQLF